MIGTAVGGKRTKGYVTLFKFQKDMPPFAKLSLVDRMGHT